MHHFLLNGPQGCSGSFQKTGLGTNTWYLVLYLKMGKINLYVTSITSIRYVRMQTVINQMGNLWQANLPLLKLLNSLMGSFFCEEGDKYPDHLSQPDY